MQNATLAAELMQETARDRAVRGSDSVQPTTIEECRVEVDAFYEPLRAVGGDYFDVVELPGNRTLLWWPTCLARACLAPRAVGRQHCRRWCGACGADRAGRGGAGVRRSTGICSGTRPATALPPQPFHRARQGLGWSWSTSTLAIILRRSFWRPEQLPRGNRNGAGWFDDTTYNISRMTVPPPTVDSCIYTTDCRIGLPGDGQDGTPGTDHDLARRTCQPRRAGRSPPTRTTSPCCW